MNAIIQLFNQHPFWSTAILTWVSNYGVSAFVSSLPVPTAASSGFYQFIFRFSNVVLAQNPSRANAPASAVVAGVTTPQAPKP